jgi:anti-sigma B factor antagonist
MLSVPAAGVLFDENQENLSVRIDVDFALVNPRAYATPLRPSKLHGTTEHIVLVHLRGNLVQGAGVSFFLEQIRLLISRGVRNFVIDLLGATCIDASGVGGLAAVYNSVRDACGEIKYVSASDELLSSIRRNHPERVFEIYQDETSALASF